MTSPYAQRAGCSKVIHWKDQMGIDADAITVPELLKQAGYSTGMVGKWPRGEHAPLNPEHHGFDSFFGFMQVRGLTQDSKPVSTGPCRCTTTPSKPVMQASIWPF
jgi:arylsulfatase A-like enzyme